MLLRSIASTTWVHLLFSMMWLAGTSWATGLIKRNCREFCDFEGQEKPSERPQRALRMNLGYQSFAKKWHHCHSVSHGFGSMKWLTLEDPDVRYLYYPVAYWREASDRSPKSGSAASGKERKKGVQCVLVVCWTATHH